MKSISGVCFSLALSVCINIASVGAQFEEINFVTNDPGFAFRHLQAFKCTDELELTFSKLMFRVYIRNKCIIEFKAIAGEKDNKLMGMPTDLRRKIFSKCHRNDKSFDNCMKDAINDIRPYFKDGISDLGVASFDPHFATQVEQKRGGYNANYNLKLTNVYERGWTISKVTKFKTDWKNNRIIYSQFFPEKSLSGSYDLTAFALGTSMSRSGIWNMTLYDYTQTTTITRKPVVVNGRKEYNGQPVDVKVEIDKIDNMQIHVSNILNGNNILGNVFPVTR